MAMTGSLGKTVRTSATQEKQKNIVIVNQQSVKEDFYKLGE